MNERDAAATTEELPEESVINHPSSQNTTSAKRRKAPAWSLGHISELSQTARTIHTVYVGFLIYCGLTIFSTSDRRLILDEAAHLPIISLDVSFSAFVIIGPLIAVILFVYFQLHLQVLKNSIDRLKSKHGPIEKGQLFPWMITMAEESETGRLGTIQRIMVKLSLWWLLPLVLFLFTTLTLKTHEIGVIFFQFIITFVGAFLALWFWYKYERFPAQGTKGTQGSIEKLTNGLMTYFQLFCLGATIALGSIYLLAMVTEDTHFYVDLAGQILIKEQKEEYEGIYWGDFRGAHLEGAILRNTVLKRADLRQSYLQGANLERSNLIDADLSEANLHYVNFSGANLQGAHFVNADLSSAYLNCGDLSGVDFQGANLSGASLVSVDVSAAKNLTISQISQVTALFQVKLDDLLMGQLRTECPKLFKEPSTRAEILKEQIRKGAYPENIILSDRTEGTIERDESIFLLSDSESVPRFVWFEKWTHRREIKFGQDYLDRTVISPRMHISCE